MTGERPNALVIRLDVHVADVAKCARHQIELALQRAVLGFEPLAFVNDARGVVHDRLLRGDAEGAAERCNRRRSDVGAHADDDEPRFIGCLPDRLPRGAREVTSPEVPCEAKRGKPPWSSGGRVVKPGALVSDDEILAHVLMPISFASYAARNARQP